MGELMRVPTRTIAFAAALGASLATGLWAWDLHLRSEVFERFGAAPGMATTFQEAGDPTCEVVLAVSPPAHYNWFGRIWQEASLDWGDVLVQHPPPREFPHGRSGPVVVGDVVCGFGEVSDIRYVHRPTGVVLTETCESYRCPFG